MIPVTTLLQILTRAEVTEVCLTSGRRAVALEGDRAQEIGGDALTSDDLLQILFSSGGSRYVDSLGPTPTQWRTRVEGVGVVVVSAAMKGDVIEARFAPKPAPGGGAAPARPRAPSNPPSRGAPRSTRSRRGDGPPSSRRSKADRAASTVPDGGVRHAARSAPRTPHEGPMRPRHPDEPATPRVFGDRDRPSFRPTPARGIEIPREAMGSLLDLELELEIPSVPSPAPPVAIVPPPKPPANPPPPAATSSPAATSPPTGTSRRAMVVTLPPPQMDETPTGPGPNSPRTLPEARYSSGPPSPAPAPRARNPGRTTRPFAREAHTPALHRLLRMARDLSASDLHLCAGRPALVRVVGQVLPRGEALDPILVEDMVLSRVPRRLEEAFDRDGSCDFSMEEPELGRFRVNVSRYRGGVKASLRLVPLRVPTLASLGLPAAIGAATRHHQGLIVLTGPTGHGKTTTLAAVVDILNSETTRHVITVEDPIEHVHPRKRALLSQREVGTHTRSFHSALKAALREDPDVIVVGELRDTETVRMALEASETGHLVLGTMSTPSAAKAIDRLIDLFPPGDQQQVRMTLAGGLRLLVSQRLLPDAENKAMVAAAELLPGMVPLWNLIRDNRTYQIPSLQQRGRELGVIRLDDSLRDLVRAGKTSAAAAVAVAEAPDELEQSLGIRQGTPAPGGSVPAAAPSAPGSKPDSNPRSTSPVRLDGKPPDPPSTPRGLFDRVFKKGG